DGAVAGAEGERAEAGGVLDRLGVRAADSRQGIRDAREVRDLRRRFDDAARRDVPDAAAPADVRSADVVPPDRGPAAVLAVAEDDRRPAVLVELDVVVQGVGAGGL